MNSNFCLLKLKKLWNKMRQVFEKHTLERLGASCERERLSFGVFRVRELQTAIVDGRRVRVAQQQGVV